MSTDVETYAYAIASTTGFQVGACCVRQGWVACGAVLRCAVLRGWCSGCTPRF